VRVFRITSFLRFERNFASFGRVRRVFRTQSKELTVAVFVSIVMVLLFGTLIYYLESRDALDSSDFASIATCIVWAAQALSGNFPYFPQSSAGKVVSAIMGFIGIGLYALPAGELDA
jgi:voltage-gated potassium channel